ncbi:IS110 family transposase [Plantactinospora sp. WMMB334]|uniref:IS110 family transposase n=1 Tax=Plantactinospora sp. WMMB334 TaxID=3404119 RepID=UPI003B954372
MPDGRELMARYFCGLDWGERHHDIAVIDQTGTLVAQLRITDTADGLAELLTALKQVKASRRDIPIGIETGRGLIVAGLRKAGQPVVVLNPTQVARYRDRLAAQRKKSDRTDAHLLAHILRVDGDAHRPLSVASPLSEAIRELARAHRKLAHDGRWSAARLRSRLWEFFPAALDAWPQRAGLTRPDARTILAAAPTPGRAALLTHQRLEDLLAAAGRTRLIADEADRLAGMFARPALRQPPEIEDAMGHQTSALVAQLDVTIANAARLLDQVEQLVDQHPQAVIYRSMPGVGPILAGRLLGELGDDPGRFPTARHLRAYCAATPITWASGSSHRHSHRRRANPVLAEAGHLWAFAALTRSSGARALYDRRRKAGDRHAAALRRLYAHLLGSLHYCLRHNVTFSETRAFRALGEPADVAEPAGQESG